MSTYEEIKIFDQKSNKAARVQTIHYNYPRHETFRQIKEILSLT